MRNGTSVRYIGVTGFMKPEDVSQALGALSEESDTRLMAGILVSSNLRTVLEKGRAARFPFLEALHQIPVVDDRCLNLVHYNTDDRDTLSDQLRRILDLGGGRIDGFQLNVAWPDPKQIAFLRDHFVVLQVGHRAMERVGNAAGLVERLRAYDGLVDTVLLDPSSGLGRPFDVERAIELVEAINAANPIHGLDVGVAGGLGPDTLDLIDPLIERGLRFSIDAEGKLQIPEGGIDIMAMTAYIARAERCFRAR